jgi:hypothetical protein
VSFHAFVQVLHSNPGGYLQQRKQLVALSLHYASVLRVAQEVAHSAVCITPILCTLPCHTFCTAYRREALTGF